MNHPSYDRFWQKWLPFDAEFASIDIPVLTVTGYYSAGQTAALYYFTQHVSQDANADHALLIGPFDSPAVEHGASASVRELGLDLVARIDPNDARYEWFEHVLAGSGEAGHLERQRQLRARRRERMAPRAVARGARKQAQALLPSGLARRRAA